MDVVSYTSVDRMLLTLPEIGSMYTVSSAQLLLHAADAEALINAALAKRYSLPISGDVPLLTAIATDLAIYRALTGRITIKAEHPWFVRYKAALDMLEKIVSGDVPLVTTSGTLVGVSQMVPWSTTMTYNPTHWEGGWTMHAIDSDKLEAEADKRR